MLTFHERWEGDRLAFEAGGLGQQLTRRLDVADDSVQIQIDLPEIRGRLQQEGQKLLEKK